MSYLIFNSNTSVFISMDWCEIRSSLSLSFAVRIKSSFLNRVSRLSSFAQVSFSTGTVPFLCLTGNRVLRSSWSIYEDLISNKAEDEGCCDFCDPMIKINHLVSSQDVSLVRSMFPLLSSNQSLSSLTTRESLPLSPVSSQQEVNEM